MIVEEFVVGLFASTIRLGIPLLLAALGEVFTQRSGVLNLGIEGIMVMGAFGGFAGTSLTGNIWLGILFGTLIGGLIGLFMGFMSVTLRVNQVITGIMIVILGTGLVAFLLRVFFGGTWIPVPARFKPLNIPFLIQIPVLGQILFGHNLFVYLGLLAVPILAFVLFRTTWGLKIRAVGENPRAADTLGINVYLIRYLCITFGGIMAGLAGAYLTLSHIGLFSETVIAGRGWIVIALVVFGSWEPYKVMGGSLLFGFLDAFQMRFQVLNFPVPYEFVLMMPYVLTIVALVSIARKGKAPKALCIPYERF